MKPRTAYLQSMEPVNGKFDVYCAGCRGWWTIDQIKMHVAQGGGLEVQED